MRDKHSKPNGRKKTNAFSTITFIFLVLLWTAFLFYCGGHGYQDIVHAKYRVFLVICGGYILLMAVACVEAALLGTLHLEDFSLKKIGLVHWIVAILILATWLSAVFSPHFPETVIGASRYEGALTITIYGLCFILVSYFGRPSKSLLYVFGVSTVLFCTLCLVQLAGRNPFTLYPEGYNYFGANKDYPGAYLGTIGNVDLVASFLSLVIPFAWVGLLRLGGRERFLLVIPLLLSLVVLFKMSVLAGFAGVFFGALLSLPVVLPVGKRIKLWLALAVLATTLAGVIICWTVDLGGGMLHELHEMLHGNISGAFGSGRLRIWKEILERVPSHFFLGTGPDTMMYADIEPFTRYDESLHHEIVSYIDVAHNEYLNILYHQGIFAFLTYLTALGILARGWLKESSSSPVAAMLGCAALCYCVQAFFGFSMCITAPFFWTALGLLNGCGQNTIGRENNVEKNRKS